MAVFNPFFVVFSFSAKNAVKNDGWIEYDVANVGKKANVLTPKF